MKVKPSVKKRCDNCQIVRRKSGQTGKSVVHVICQNKRHRQRQK